MRGSVHFWHTGSAGRSATARPCRPATAFDFRRHPARGRAHAWGRGEVLALLPAGRPAPGRAPPRAIDCFLLLPPAPSKAIGVTSSPIGLRFTANSSASTSPSVGVLGEVSRVDRRRVARPVRARLDIAARQRPHLPHPGGHARRVVEPAQRPGCKTPGQHLDRSRDQRGAVRNRPSPRGRPPSLRSLLRALPHKSGTEASKRSRRFRLFVRRHRSGSRRSWRAEGDQGWRSGFG